MAGIDRVQTLKSIDEGTYYDGEQPEVGDIIECLPEEGSFPNLKELEQYTVEEIDGGYVFFEGNGWWPARFCLISRGPSEEKTMHYRNGREANNGDKIVQLDGEGHVTAFGELRDAVPGNDYCNGDIYTSINGGTPVKTSYACMCDCLHIDDVAGILKEKGLDKRPAGK